MINRKPELNDNDRRRLNAVYAVLKNRKGNATKKELCYAVSWSYPGHERQIRDVISIVAKRFPIISLAGDEGYRLAKYESDLDDAIHQINDLDSRIAELKARKTPLENFVTAARAQMKEKA